jgi:hypothetical protein
MTLLHRCLGATLALVVFTASAGARNPEGTPAPTRPGPASRTADAALARRLCDILHEQPARRRGECCGATAAASLAPACAREVTAALGRGTVTLDAAAVERCAAETTRQLDGCGWVRPQLPPLPPACGGLVAGSLPAGRSCRSSLECAEPLYCRGLSPARPGTCGRPALARERCENLADNLAAFTRAGDDPRHRPCAGRCVRGQCLPFVAAGGTCTASPACAPGLNCLAGRCADRPLPAVGEPCPGKTLCAAGAFCQAGRCVAIKQAGEPCVLPIECRALACTRVPGARTGACADPCATARSGNATAADPSGPD